MARAGGGPALFLLFVDFIALLLNLEFQRVLVVSATARKLMCEPDHERGPSYAVLRDNFKQGSLGHPHVIIIIIIYYSYTLVKVKCHANALL